MLSLSRNFVIMLCILFAIGLLAGCSANELPKVSDNSTQTASKSPLQISMVIDALPDYQLDDNPVIKEIERLANVKLDIELPPHNNYEERLSIIAASGDTPDIIFVPNFNNNYFNWSEEGILLPLDEYFAKMPNFQETITKEQLDRGRVIATGKVHLVVRPHVDNLFGYNIRTDWLEKLGLDAPTTLDEFYNVAKAFTQNDPDGNGKNDTYGWSFTQLDRDAVLMSAFDVRLPFAPDKNGNVTIPQAQPEYIAMMEFTKKLFDDKILEPEFYTNVGASVRDKFQMGVLGIETDFIKPNDFLGNRARSLINAFPGAKVEFNPPLKNANGEINLYTQPSTWGGYAVSNTCKNVEGVLDFIDWGFSKEGRELYLAGVKDVTYTSFETNSKGVMGRLVMTEEQAALSKKYVAIQIGFVGGVKGDRIVNPGYTTIEQDMFEEAINLYAENVNIQYIDNITSLPAYAELFKTDPDVDNKFKQIQTKYIVGEASKEELVNYINNVYIPAYSEVIAQMQEYYDKK